MFKRLLMVAGLVFIATAAQASYQDPEPEISTEPIGSSYYRHLAKETNIDIRELVKFERRGFGRTEINVLILISSGSVQTLKDYGNRRLKDSVPLQDLVKEANLDFDQVYAQARELKLRIELMGDGNLPPPVFEVAASTPTVAPAPPKKEKKEKKKKADPIDEKPVLPKPD